MNASRLIPLALALLCGCTFNWGSEGIEDVKVGGRPTAEIGASGEPASPSTAPTADASTNADAASTPPSAGNADAASAAPADAETTKKSGGWFSGLFGDDEEEEQSNLVKVAVLPVAWREQSGAEQPCDLCSLPTEMKPTSSRSARLITGFVYEAVARHPRILFPTPETVDAAVSAAPGRSLRAAAASLAAAGRADYVIASALLELRHRVGPDDGPEKSAGVALYVALVNASSGEVMWSGTFDEDESGRGILLRPYDRIMNDKPVRWSSAEGFSEKAVDELVEDLIDELP